MTLFDYGEQLKELGMERAAEAHADKLGTARRIAAHIANVGDGTAHAGQVGEELDRRGIATGNWCGSIFRGAAWEATGRFVKSTRASRHAGLVQVWRLKK